MFFEKFRLDDEIDLVTGDGRCIGRAPSRAPAEAVAAVMIAEVGPAAKSLMTGTIVVAHGGYTCC